MGGVKRILLSPTSKGGGGGKYPLFPLPVATPMGVIARAQYVFPESWNVSWVIRSTSYWIVASVVFLSNLYIYDVIIFKFLGGGGVVTLPVPQTKLLYIVFAS